MERFNMATVTVGGPSEAGNFLIEPGVQAPVVISSIQENLRKLSQHLAELSVLKGNHIKSPYTRENKPMVTPNQRSTIKIPKNPERVPRPKISSPPASERMRYSRSKTQESAKEE